MTWVPGVGSDLKSARDLLELGRQVLGASQTMVAVVNQSIQTDSSEQVTRLLQERRIDTSIFQSLSKQAPALRTAMTELENASRIQQRLQREHLDGNLQEKVTAAGNVLTRLQVLGRMSLAAAESWESFLGYDSPKRYLIVAHNSDELRATGGFVPGAWIAVFDHGYLAELTFWDTTAVDSITTSPPLPPQGLLETIWAGAWLFRDASWYPDFPESAQVMARYFQMGRSLEIDGVIGANQWALQEILRALGTVTLPSGQSMTADTFLPLLEDGTDAEGRAYMDTILQAVLQRLEENPSPILLASLFAALDRSLSQKHILLAFDQPALRAMAAENQWDGKVQTVEGDYLMAVDSNVGFNKVNRNIERTLNYSLQLDPAGGEAHLEIIYANKSRRTGTDGCAIQGLNPAPESYEALKHGCYWNFLRIYTPLGAALEGSSPFPMPQGALYRRIGYNDIEDTGRAYQEGDKQVYAGFFTVPAGSTRSIAFQYRLPQAVVRKDGDLLVYRLTLQKQPGVVSDEARIVISLPEGYRIQSQSEPASAEDGRSLEYALHLISDKEITLVLVRK
jgi:hypothetical protein